LNVSTEYVVPSRELTSKRKRLVRAFLIATLAAATAYAQTSPARVSRPFVAKDYPAGKFLVTESDSNIGEFTVRVIDVKNLGYEPSANQPHFCSTWVEVRKSDQLVKRVFYGDIEPVGSNFGAFVSKIQPDGYIAVVKEGDYDGRLLLVDAEGKMVDLPGGFYFVTADKKFLISEYSSDATGLTVFDLAEHEIILQPKDVPEIGSWYRDPQGYFFMEYEGGGKAQRLDFSNRRMLKIVVSESEKKKAAKVRYDFDPRSKKDCVATPQ